MIGKFPYFVGNDEGKNAKERFSLSLLGKIFLSVHGTSVTSRNYILQNERKHNKNTDKYPAAVITRNFRQFTELYFTEFVYRITEFRDSIP